ncbi:MAG: radical SAM family heme chaperone HemW [Akkermansia sp.]|nr:radical SAM family heme chaperone HemW [Akkermansia sp.]
MAHLYVHIPFCHRICPYCAFFKHTPADTDMRGFVRAIVQEARLRLPQGYAPETIYFGGGTPSMLSPTHLGNMIRGLEEVVDFSQVREWSFESNPATFTAEKVQQWRELGITRVSLGVQSFEPRLLQLLGRTHSPEEVVRDVELLRRIGIPQINIDLMFSLPGQTISEWEHTLQTALSLAPEHISTYNLSYEEDTAFYRQFGSGAGDEETDVRMFEMSDDILTAAGYRHYEISNYALPGCRSLHNLACWRGEDYYALGSGAVGSVAGVRYQNSGDTTTYIRTICDGGLPPGTSERLRPETRRTELLGLMLRTDEGLPPQMIRPEDTAFVAMLQQENLATLSADGRLLLTRSGRLVADEIAVGLL